ncbi:MAG TPA: acyl-CoA synthetase, partial [Gammaproteobacteria bacterium]|nr:acyl-CoA synthetase [Gammaproteobacteria bacterium]
MNELHRPLYAPDLLVNALNQDARRPLLEVPGGERLTVGDMRDSTSQYVQALAALGLGKGSRIGLLSSNRPEVLVVANAIQVTAAAYVPLHPMAG